MVVIIGLIIVVVGSILDEFIPDIEEVMELMVTIGSGLIFVGVIIGIIKIIVK